MQVQLSSFGEQCMALKTHQGLGGSFEWAIGSWNY